VTLKPGTDHRSCFTGRLDKTIVQQTVVCPRFILVIRFTVTEALAYPEAFS